MTRTCYNDNDPEKAEWARELIARGLTARGDVDEKSVLDVRPDDLRAYTQVHLFSGINGWSRALRLAGWSDDRAVWTASCPCPPFSSAGKQKPCPECGGTNPVPCPCRTGFFICCLCDHAWLADERHLWPEVWRLVRDCRPRTIFGEQVASADGRIWLGTVSASLEILGYSFLGSDLCSSGIGAPNIRQRLWWRADRLADADFAGQRIEPDAWLQRPYVHDADGRIADGGLEHAPGDGRDQRRAEPGGRGAAGGRGAGGLGNADDGQYGKVGLIPARSQSESDGMRIADQPGPVNGFWRDADWISGRDGKWRPIKSGTSSLVAGLPAGMVRGGDSGAPDGEVATAEARVMRLKGYGDAINPEVAAAWIMATEGIAA